MTTKTHFVGMSVSALFQAMLLVSTGSALEPASVFTDNMVLQRDRPIPVWGTAEAGQRVEVRFSNDQVAVHADAAGHWMATLGPLSANGQPQTLVIRGGENTRTIENVLVGDVWLCAGQSNMQLPLGESAGGKRFAKEQGRNPRLRLLIVPKQFAAKPRVSQEGRWMLATPEAASQFSAVGFSFGATLAAAPAMQGVPIGIIDCTFGGTAVEGWIPQADLESFPKRELSQSMFGQPSEHYNAMLCPLVPLAICGVVWYQGESNSDRPEVYGQLLSHMIDTWRREFRDPELPFILIQLPAYNAPFQTKFFTWIREQQASVANATEGVSLVVTYDTHDGSDLHPREKIRVGERAGLVARGRAYGEDLVTRGPRYAEMSILGDQCRVRFDTEGETLATSDGRNSLRGFQLAGGDGEFRFARGAIVDRDTVSIRAPGLADPKHIRFAWAGVPDANLASTAGLPAEPFRTDHFPPKDVEFVRVPNHRGVKTPRYELELDAAGSLRSLGIQGQQFIANELGMDGGSCIPTFFGPRDLNQVREVGPQQLVFRDNEASVAYVFNTADIHINVTNHSSATMEFRLALAPEVSRDNDPETGADEKAIALNKGVAGVRAVGFDEVSTSDGKSLRLISKIPAQEARSMRLEVRK